MKREINIRLLIAYIFDISIILSFLVLFIKKFIFIDYTPTFHNVLFNWKFQMLMILVDAVYLLSSAFQISRYGSTVGMYLSGINITDANNHSLSFENSLNRSKKVLIYAGLNNSYLVPGAFIRYIIILFRENDDIIKLIPELSVKKKENNLFSRSVTFIITIGLVLLLFIYIPSVNNVQSKEQFISNFNKYVLYLRLSTDYRMDNNGEWMELIPNVEYEGTLRYPKPIVAITENKISFYSSITQINKNAPSYKNVSLSAVLAAIPDTTIIQRMEIKRMFDNNEYKSFSLMVNGVSVKYDVNYSGYQFIDGYLKYETDVMSSFEYKLDIIGGWTKE